MAECEAATGDTHHYLKVTEHMREGWVINEYDESQPANCRRIIQPDVMIVGLVCCRCGGAIKRTFEIVNERSSTAEGMSAT